MTKINEQGTLHAFFDLSVSGADFDFTGFLILAEWCRRKENKKKLHVILIKESDTADGKSNQFNKSQRAYRLNQIVIPLCSFLPSCKSISICSDHEEAEIILQNSIGNIFPKKYTIKNPIERLKPIWNLLVANQGFNLQFFRSTPQALKYVKEWIDITCSGKKIVTITIRNSFHQKQKNTNSGPWIEFANKIQKDGFYVIVIPDTNTALHSPAPEYKHLFHMPVAAVNLEIRMALYELSHLCMFSSNGPAALGFFNPNIQFVQILAPEYITPEGRLETWQCLKTGRDDPSLSTYQHLIWKENNFNTISKAFYEMSNKIDRDKKNGIFNNLLIPDKRNIEPDFVIGQRLIKHKLWDELEFHAKLVLERQPKNLPGHYWRGTALKNSLKVNNIKLTKQVQADFDYVLENYSLSNNKDLNDSVITSVIEILHSRNKFTKAEKIIKACMREQSCSNEIIRPLDFRNLILQKKFSAAEKKIEDHETWGNYTIEYCRLAGSTLFNEFNELSKAKSYFLALKEANALIDLDVEMLGVILEKEQKINHAELLYQFSIDSNITTPFIKYRLAIVKKRLEKYEHAAQLLESLNDQGFSDWILQKELSEVYAKIGRIEDCNKARIKSIEDRFSIR